MKYMLLIWSNPQTWESLSQDDYDWVLREHIRFQKETEVSGEHIASHALADPSSSTTVRVRNGIMTATDGPFAEAKEHLAGYYLVECDRRERAVELAARIPDAHITGIEVREIVTAPEMEE